MIIEKVDPARESFSDYVIDGTILTIADVTIDLALEEGGQQVMIQFGSCQGKVHRGLMPCCEHVADVIIPPRKYQTVVVDGPPQGATLNGVDLPATHTEIVPMPLDAESAVLNLWPLGGIQIVTNNQEEENGAE
ncbi:MAG: hypothetical protein LBQ88_17370 [Treponema sp.]|jgi:hypothetical protein|nr:hypothetical protein [Treponema sp.]